jgi:hypothetical protein
MKRWSWIVLLAGCLVKPSGAWALQQQGVLWLQGKVIGGLGLVAEGSLGRGLVASVGGGWLLLIADGFAGVVAGSGPVKLLARAHLLRVSEIELFGAKSGGKTLFGLEPGVRLNLLGRSLVLEAGVIAAPEEEEVPSRDGGVERRLRWSAAPNVGLLVRLGAI